MPAESALRDRLGSGFSLIETLRWEPQAGFVRLDRHMARLAESARELGFVRDPAAIESALAKVACGDAPLRVRLLLAPDGAASATAQPFLPLPKNTVWTLRVARARLDSNDPLLRHKTTRRTAYDAARAEFSPVEADEVVLLNERGEVCEGTITSVFIDRGDGGPLLTPPLSSGLLAGVLRQSLIEDGKAVESPLQVEDLAGSRCIYCGNSLRGLIASRLMA
ncbi:MAG: aminotransferase class IV family protein [Rhizobiaceae bacterium]